MYKESKWHAWVGFVFFGACFLFISWQCTGCLKRDADEKAEKERIKEQKRQDDAKSVEGKKIKGVRHGWKEITFEFEDGTSFTVFSVAHHGAGAHVEWHK